MSGLAAASEPLHSCDKSVTAVWPYTSDGWSTLAGMEKIMPKFHELSEDQLELVSGGVGAPNATALNAGVPDATADARKSAGGQSSGMMFLTFQFKLVAVTS